MTFYASLRDDTAAPLIAEYGQAATYRGHGSYEYSVATGRAADTAPRDTAVRLLDLPLPDREFSEHVTQRASAMFLVGAKEFAAANVVPEVDDRMVVGTDTYTILAINTIGPAGEAVVYKMAAQHV